MVKVGIRRRSFKGSFSAMTKGRATRSFKRAIIPGYGKRGMGWLHPKRKIYNQIYSRTTVDSRKLFSNGRQRRTNHSTNSGSNQNWGWGMLLLFLLVGFAIVYWKVVLVVIVVLGALVYFFKN
ncbi:hypothetical protein [uncultured Lacticaseibacillus sp.]|uniref:hypothetical protein n=1 Tax=uncultured Lacticaseibacillus sp. TaxID=2775882 RepID=UPI002593316E|nr:hypothetical protein [uncultured Lacticaseibacillus sp.]